ncbi:hypothetical protein OFB82_24630, partial [Escherichia coli]|nr:hypothetical protein [Escherichia coli]
MANHETHSVIAGGIESDLHIDSSKYPHPFCSLLQKRAHFDSFKHLIFIRGLLVIAHGKRKNKISASMVSFYVSLVGTVAKLAMRQPFVLFKGLTFQKLCLPGAFRPGDHHNK